MNQIEQSRYPGPVPVGNIGYGISADFDVTLQKLGIDGRVVSMRTPIRKCPNLITDYGLDFLGDNPISRGSGATTGAFTNYLSVGSGSTAPAFGDSALVAKVAHVVTGGVGDNTIAWDTTDPDRVVCTRVFTFGVGAAAGAITELGLHPTAAGTLTTRALFKDAFGDPTVVDVDSDEQLVVTYRIYIKPSLADSTFITTQNGTEYTITTRCASIRSAIHSGGVAYNLISGNLETQNSRSAAVTVYSGLTSAIGAVTTVPAGTANVLNTIASPNWQKGVYTNGNHWRDDSVTLPFSVANVTNIGAIMFEGVPFRVQVGISPRLNKTSLDTIKVTIRTSWARG